MNFHKLQLIVLLKIQHFHIQFATSLLCGLYVSNVYDRILVFLYKSNCTVSDEHTRFFCKTNYDKVEIK